MSHTADGGYTRSRVLLTPVIETEQNSPENDFTLELTHIRCCVEQTIGILTTMWKSIKRSRTLYYQPEKVVKIIHACAILHNFIRRNG